MRYKLNALITINVLNQKLTYLTKSVICYFDLITHCYIWSCVFGNPSILKQNLFIMFNAEQNYQRF